jgi:hypothetical protein
MHNNVYSTIHCLNALLNSTSPQVIHNGDINHDAAAAVQCLQLPCSKLCNNMYRRLKYQLLHFICVSCLQHFYHIIDKIMKPLCGDDDECNKHFLKKPK